MKKSNRTTPETATAGNQPPAVLESLIKTILHAPPFVSNRAFNSARYRLRIGKMEETTMFRILRLAGWQVREEKKENGGLMIHIDPPKV